MTAPPVLVTQQTREAATEWALRLEQDAALTAAEAEALAQWLDGSPDRHLVLARRREMLADPAFRRALERAASPARGLHWTRPAFSAAGLAAAAAALIAAAALVLAPGETLPAPEAASHVTTLAETRLITLEDGTTVQMNADTRLTVTYTHDQRHVTLVQGEAAFDVPSDPERPFLVSAPGFDVRVVGTRFNVNTTGAGARVDVHQGQVDVAGHGHQARLSAGAAALIRRGPSGWSLTETAASEVDWRDGWVELDNASLLFLLENLNRYSDRPYRAAPGARTLSVTGRFRVNDPARTLELVSQFFGLNVSDQGDHYTVAAEP